MTKVLHIKKHTYFLTCVFTHCYLGFSVPKPPQCMNALGMENGNIPDSAISAFSSSNANSYAPSVGRLHFLMSGSGKYGSWAAGANNLMQWFRVDFGRWTKVTAVATQGRQDSNQWVKKYSLSYSYNEVFWATVKNEQGSKQVLKWLVNLRWRIRRLHFGWFVLFRSKC